MVFCINCGRELVEEFEFCPECGQRVNSDVAGASFPDGQFNRATITCNRCGTAMPADALYCLNCGSQINNTAAPVDFEEIQKSIRKNAKLGRDRRKKWIAMLLCLFFGWLGLHRFYEGKVITGLLWLFTFGFLGLGWFIDIILTIAMPSENLWKQR